jgi:hypothetical protein
MDFLPVPPHARQEVVLWPWHLGHNVFGILLVSQASSTLTISAIPQDVDAGQFRPSVAGFDFHSVRL